MTCDHARQFLLEAGWDASGRRDAAEFLRHAETCDACRAALQDYDALRAMMSPALEVPEPAGGWEALERGLARCATAHQSRRHIFRRAAMAIAASILVVIGIFQAGRHVGSRSQIATTPRPASRPAAPALPPRDAANDVRQFREISRQGFEDRASWMLVSQDATDVGLAPSPLPAARRLLVLRLALWRQGESISTADLIVVAGQNADVNLPLSAGESLQYRIGTSIEQPTHLKLGLAIKTPSRSEPLAVLATSLDIHPGQLETVGSLATLSGNYELKVELAREEVSTVGR